ncbi:MAG: hypothetical protein ACK55I_06345, partial [bacterium]
MPAPPPRLQRRRPRPDARLRRRSSRCGGSSAEPPLHRRRPATRHELPRNDVLAGRGCPGRLTRRPGARSRQHPSHRAGRPALSSTQPRGATDVAPAQLCRALGGLAARAWRARLRRRAGAALRTRARQRSRRRLRARARAGLPGRLRRLR